MTSENSEVPLIKGWQQKATLQYFKRFKVPSKSIGTTFAINLIELDFSTSIRMQVSPLVRESEVEVSFAYEKRFEKEVEKLIITIEKLYNEFEKEWN
jgi:hypothetical protein